MVLKKILQAETYQRYEVWYEVDWRDKVDQAPNVHKGTQSTLSKIHDKQTKLGTYLILYSVQHMPQPPVLIHLECCKLVHLMFLKDISEITPNLKNNYIVLIISKLNISVSTKSCKNFHFPPCPSQITEVDLS